MARVRRGYFIVVVASADTDVLVSLLYHYHQMWKCTSHQLQLCWIPKSGDEKAAYPLHTMCQQLADISSGETNAIEVSPAMHSLK